MPTPSTTEPDQTFYETVAACLRDHGLAAPDAKPTTLDHWIKQEPDIYDQCFNETLHTFGSEWPSSTGETDESHNVIDRTSDLCRVKVFRAVSLTWGNARKWGLRWGFAVRCHWTFHVVSQRIASHARPARDRLRRTYALESSLNAVPGTAPTGR
jgi:hypothetical protein